MYFMHKNTMGLVMWISTVMLLAVHGGSLKNCHPGCRCEVETFGLFDSFSLTKVDCSGVGPGGSPIPIPLDTSLLDLSSNSIGTVTDSMLSGPGYTTLISLDLSSNHITHVSAKALSKLRYLETLDLSHNFLEGLADGCFSGLPLVEVDLSHNRFHQFGLELFAKGHGEPVSVDLSNNLLTKVFRKAQGTSPNIKSLVLAGNQLKMVPKLKGIPLRYLNLDANSISTIETEAFEELKDLVHLSLSGLSELSMIQPKSFQGLQNLQVLDLSNNAKLKSLNPMVFSGLASLQELNLSKSGVTSLPNNMLSHLPSIRSITLGHNVHCWRSKKQVLFHRQMEQIKEEDMLTCDVDGVVL